MNFCTHNETDSFAPAHSWWAELLKQVDVELGVKRLYLRSKTRSVCKLRRRRRGSVQPCLVR